MAIITAMHRQGVSISGHRFVSDTTRVEETIRAAARSCGTLAADCSDAAGLANEVATIINAQSEGLHQLTALSASLSSRHDDMVASTGDAQAMVHRAREAIDSAHGVIMRSVTALGDLASEVAAMGARAASVGAAIDTLNDIAIAVERVAKQSRILALNAAIEAERAGADGSAFGTVAAEMGTLAKNTQESTRQVGLTVADLRREAGALIQDVGKSAAHAKQVGSEIDSIQGALDTMRQMVQAVDDNGATVSQHGTDILQAGEALRRNVASFAGDAERNGDYLGRIYHRCERLELEANLMLDMLSKSGVPTDDTPFLNKTMAIAREIETVCEAAIAERRISIDAVFDTNYRPVAGTDPEQLLTRFCDFADAHIRPILDRVTGEDRRMIGCVVSDLNGYLPTHLTLRSQPQRGDPTWNDRWSRHRRILLDPATARAIASDDPVLLTCYRMPLGANSYLPIKSAFAPLVIAGRRWGQYEFSYVDEWSEMAEALTHAGLQHSLAEGNS